MKQSLILYVGEREAGEALAARVEQDGGFVYLPESLMQVLGMYITYFPEVIVIDMSLSYADEIYRHLRSVDAAPIILLTDEHIRSTSVFALPRASSAEAVVEMLERVLQPQRVPIGVLRYA
ncbi:MAG: hypothetical protein IT319_14380 [Anaerolineae bacterium]|nr:hypothetical protein [Anaerolineae bacterium]